MRKDQRDIYFFDVISVTWHRKFHQGIKPFPHRMLADTIHDLYKIGRSHVINSKHQAIYIRDMKVYTDRCEMLVGFADTLAADPTFADWLAKKRRTEKKVGDEGIEHTAHMIWKYGSDANDGTCPFLLEVATGLPSSKVQAFFNRLLRVASKATNRFLIDDPEARKDKDGNFLKIKTRPKIELVGQPSAEFLKDLKQGTLQEVELFTQKEKGKAWDDQGRVLEEKTSVSIKPNPEKIVPKAKALLDAFVPGSASTYEYARVRFKTRSEVARTVSVMSQNYSIVSNNLYVRKERIDDIGDNLPTAFEKMYPAIITKMRALLN